MKSLIKGIWNMAVIGSVLGVPTTALMSSVNPEFLFNLTNAAIISAMFSAGVFLTYFMLALMTNLYVMLTQRTDGPAFVFELDPDDPPNHVQMKLLESEFNDFVLKAGEILGLDTTAVKKPEAPTDE